MSNYPYEEFFQRNNIQHYDGYSQQIRQQVDALKSFVNQPGVQRVLEIGFNGGHSANLFLTTNASCIVHSLDLGHYSFVKLAKQEIDKRHPNRHNLKLGDSMITIPKLVNITNEPYDLIFIDGGHSYEVAKSDLVWCKKLAHKNTILIMDDTVSRKDWIQHWNNGPNRAWDEECSVGNVCCEGKVDYGVGRGMSWGKYKI